MEQFAVRKENPLEYKPIGLLLVEFAVPATIAVLVNAVYNIVDQIFIGQGVGYLGNAATTVSFPVMTIRCCGFLARRIRLCPTPGITPPLFWREFRPAYWDRVFQTWQGRTGSRGCPCTES